MLRRPALALVLGTATLACVGDGAPGATPAPAPVTEALPYRLDAPDAAFALPDRLREISGLTVLEGGHLGAVQDEDGVLFVLDAATGAVTAEHRFHDAGDYEGVERVGDRVWVLQSDGTLFEIRNATADAPERTRHETPLHRRCDAEGLAYDAPNARLLIACKEDPGPELTDVRAIYAFDLRAKRLSERPVFVLDRRALDRPPRRGGAAGAAFKPSALAVHPTSGRIYVLSSARKALAVLSPEGTLLEAVALPERLYPQPESLTFLPDGTLFIASEGESGDATLLRFAEATP